jgi:hypothetical protein
MNVYRVPCPPPSIATPVPRTLSVEERDDDAEPGSCEVDVKSPDVDASSRRVRALAYGLIVATCVLVFVLGFPR